MDVVILVCYISHRLKILGIGLLVRVLKKFKIVYFLQASLNVHIKFKNKQTEYARRNS